MKPPTDSLGSVSPVAAALDRRRLSRASCPLRWSNYQALVRRYEAQPGGPRRALAARLLRVHRRGIRCRGGRLGPSHRDRHERGPVPARHNRWWGTVPPELGLAARLVRRGHEVRLLADPTVEPAAIAAGCTFSAWRLAPHFNTLDEQTALIADMEQRNPARQFVFARDQIICGPAGNYAADVLGTMDEHPVDAVLAEAAVAGALIGAEASGLPTAALMPNIYLRPTKGLPQFGTGWSPGRGPLGRARDALTAAAMKRLWASGLPAVNAARAQYDLPPIGDLYELLDHCGPRVGPDQPVVRFPGAGPAAQRALRRSATR
jgi:hypothetical protein